MLRKLLLDWIDEGAGNEEFQQARRLRQNMAHLTLVGKLIEENHTVAYPIRGRSMRIFIEHDRDKVVLAPFAPEKLRRGDVVLAQISAERFVLHRIIHAEGELLTLMGDGNLNETEHCRRRDVSALAVGFLRKGRKKPDRTSGWKWRIYSELWVRLSPCRKSLLLAWRLKERLLRCVGLQADTYRRALPTFKHPIAPDTKMRFNPSFESRNVCGEFVVINFTQEPIDFCQLIHFNETAADIYQHFQQKDFNIKDITDYLTENYDVGQHEAETSVRAMIDDLRPTRLLLLP